MYGRGAAGAGWGARLVLGYSCRCGRQACAQAVRGCGQDSGAEKEEAGRLLVSAVGEEEGVGMLLLKIEGEGACRRTEKRKEVLLLCTIVWAVGKKVSLLVQLMDPEGEAKKKTEGEAKKKTEPL